MSSKTNNVVVPRFFWVDALRGFAAIIIVVFHYHHFYLSDADDRSSIPDTTTYPYADFLFPFFNAFAANAVELFWLISGLVFAHVYLARDTSAYSFAVARFARLYPLHLATLIFVAVLQFISMETVGHWQIYGNNDVLHFVLQLFMSSNWNTWSRGLSFNGPIWSVSLEMVVYFIFFCTLPFLKKAPVAVSAILCFISWFIVSLGSIELPLIRASVFECAGFFFIGALFYALRPQEELRRVISILFVSLIFALVGSFYNFINIQICGFALVLVSLAMILDQIAPRHGRFLGPLGDISYSVYLVHVPLQMLALFIADYFFNGTRGFAESHLTLPIYVVVSLIVAYAAYHWLEKPMGRKVRNLLSLNN